MGDTISTHPTPTTTTQGYAFHDPKERAVLAVFLAVICVVGVAGNTLAIAAVCASRKLQTSTNVFVTTLAVTDLIACLFLPYHVMVLLIDHDDGMMDHLKDTFLCKCVGWIAYLTLGISVMNLALIAFNRYYLITHSGDRYKKLYNARNVGAMVCLTYLYVLLVTSTPALVIDSISYGFTWKYRLCVVHPRGDVLLGLLLSVLIKFPCLFVIVACYVRIFSYLKRKGIFEQIRRSRYNSPAVVEDRAQARRHATFVKVTKNMFTVVVAYVICIMPFAVLSPIPGLDVLVPWVCMLVIANGCVNPIIYGLSHPHFREVFGLILRGRFEEIPEPSRIIQRLRRV